MRLLYHFPFSPFARRARLALAHKQLAFELRDARTNPELLEEARTRSPLKTVPVLVEPDGRALGDSTAITHYLDRAYPDAPALWPADPGDALPVFEIASLTDAALDGVVNTGNRFYALHDSAAWPKVQDEMVSRVQRALDALGARAASLGRPTVSKGGWSAADMWLYTATAWLERLPSRVASYPPAAQLLGLGWKLPPALVRWADLHRDRADVRALD